jgi:hypothetical protein
MTGNRARVLTDRILNAADPAEPASFGLVTSQAVALDANNPARPEYETQCNGLGRYDATWLAEPHPP